MNRMKTRILAVSMLMAIAFPVAAHDVDLEVPNGHLSYAFGIQFAVQISDQLSQLGIQLSGDAVAQAIMDVLNGSELMLSDEQMQAAIETFANEQQQIQEELTQMAKQLGDDFRAEYEKGEGVVKTDSGLLYRVVEAGSGDKPTPDSTVTVHYRGTLTDGSEFDSSYSRNEPTTFGLGSIIPGWVEALQLMSPGAKYEIVLPPELAYGELGSPPVIPPMATLIFEIELLSFE